MQPVSQELGPCPCRVDPNSRVLRTPNGGVTWAEKAGQPCDAYGTKLTQYGHLVGCKCRSCLGRRNKRKGKRAQAQGHRALGGIGFTPSDEESTGGYPITVQVEWKTGDQIPANFHRFVSLDWTRRALDQANRARRVGDGSMPAVGLVVGGKTWLLVQTDRDMDGAA